MSKKKRTSEKVCHTMVILKIAPGVIGQMVDTEWDNASFLNNTSLGLFPVHKVLQHAIDSSVRCRVPVDVNEHNRLRKCAPTPDEALAIRKVSHRLSGLNATSNPEYSPLMSG